MHCLSYCMSLPSVPNITVVTPINSGISCNSGNIPRPHIILQVKLLTPFTSGLPFLLCSPFVSTLLIRKRRLVVLLICSIILCSQIYLQSKTPEFLLCSILGYRAFFCYITVLLSFLFIDTYIPMNTYTNESCMIGPVRISTIVHSSARTSSLLRLLRCTPEYLCKLCELRYPKIWDNMIVKGRNT